MRIILQRFISDSGSTLGCMSLDGQFLAWTVEDEYRRQKVMHETRIPAGRYQIVPIRFGKFFEAYKERFGHKFGLGLKDVPGFTDILIHTGNSEKDTSGCIIVGSVINQMGKTVGDSRPCYDQLYKKIEQSVLAGDCEIIIADDITA